MKKGRRKMTNVREKGLKKAEDFFLFFIFIIIIIFVFYY